MGARATWSAAVLMGLGLVPTAFSTEAPFRPSDPSYVVAELPGGALRSRDRFARQLLESRNDPEAAAQLAEELLDQARITMQPQLYGRAESVLAPWVIRPNAPARLLVMQADILQQRHEFTQATHLLDRVVAQDPRATRARLIRANTYIVTGQYAFARADCAWLLGSGEQLTGTVCLAQVMGSTGQLDRAKALLDRITTNAPATVAPEMLSWALSVRADLAVRSGSLAEAEELLIRAVKLTPSSDYVRLFLADVLLAERRSDEALQALDVTRPSAGALLRRVEAFGPGRPQQRDEALTALRERFAVSAQRGERTHLREETRLALDLSGDSAHALALARDNFAIQRETEDVRLLARAARAAHDRAALQELQDWVLHTGYQDVVVDSILHPEHTT